MNARRKSAERLAGRRGFTLVELILVLAIIGILSSLGLAIIAGAQEDAQVSRTRAQIGRISLVLNQRLEEAVYRILPVDLTGLSQKEKQWVRTAAIAELLRVEFPTRHTDLLDTAGNPFPVNTGNASILGIDWSVFPVPQLLVRHRARLQLPIDGSPPPPPPPGQQSWEVSHPSAECLYAILASITMEDGKSALSLVSASEIGDKDGDGRKEILDAFGDPLLVDLVARDSTDEEFEPDDLKTNYPHIDPTYVYPGTPPVETSRYQFMILSQNIAGKLE